MKIAPLQRQVLFPTSRGMSHISALQEQYALSMETISVHVVQISHLEASLRQKLLEDAAAGAQLLTDMNELRGELDRKKYRIA